MEERNIPISEVTIKVPWGHIAGKAWGHSNGRPVLALHGWLDNAGSFDKLIPLMSRGLYVVAIDWPGQGLSSPRPAGELYSHINMVVDLKYVIEGLEWSKFSILAHSMGAGIAVLFAASLPEYIDRIVLLEGIAPSVVKADDIPSKFGTVFKQLDAMQQKTEVVYPSLEACIERLMQANSDLTRESATIMVERGTAQVDNGFVFTRDVRAKKLGCTDSGTCIDIGPTPAYFDDIGINQNMLSYYTEEIITSYLKCIKCPVLVIIAEKSIYPPDIPRLLVNLMYDAKLIVVPGNHHVHLNHPERVAPAANEHLQKDFSCAIKSQL